MSDGTITVERNAARLTPARYPRSSPRHAIRIDQFATSSAGTTTAWRKPPIRTSSTVTCIPRSPSGNDDIGSCRWPLPRTSMTDESVSAAATAIAAIMRCGPLRISACSVRRTRLTPLDPTGKPQRDGADHGTVREWNARRPPVQAGGGCSRRTSGSPGRQPLERRATPGSRALRDSHATPDRRSDARRPPGATRPAA